MDNVNKAVDKIKENKGISIGIVVAVIIGIIVLIIAVVLFFKYGKGLFKGGGSSLKPEDLVITGYKSINEMGDINPGHAIGTAIKDKTPKECAIECNNNNSCELFTYNIKDKSCLLRKATYNLEHDENLFTAVKENPDSKIIVDSTNPYKIYSGKKQGHKDISGWIKSEDGNSMSYCRDACDKLDTCRGIMENTATNECILKGDIDVEYLEKDLNSNIFVKKMELKDYDQFYGVDTNVQAYDELATHDLSKCVDYCNNDPKCEGFVQQFGHGTCWFKNAGMYDLTKFINPDQRERNLWRKDKKTTKEWGKTIEATTELSTPKYTSLSLNIDSCKKLCEESDKCDGFNYLKNEKQCQFKEVSDPDFKTDTNIDYYLIKKKDPNE